MMRGWFARLDVDLADVDPNDLGLDDPSEAPVLPCRGCEARTEERVQVGAALVPCCEDCAAACGRAHDECHLLACACPDCRVFSRVHGYPEAVPVVEAPALHCFGCGAPTAARHITGEPCCVDCETACDRLSEAHVGCGDHCYGCAIWRRVVGVLPPAPPLAGPPTLHCRGCGAPTVTRHVTGEPCCDGCEAACDRLDETHVGCGDDCLDCGTWRRVVGVLPPAAPAVPSNDNERVACGSCSAEVPPGDLVVGGCAQCCVADAEVMDALAEAQRDALAEELAQCDDEEPELRAVA